jgi:RES domain-containing protein
VEPGIDPVPVAGTWWRHLPAGGDPLWWPPEPPDGRWQRGHVVGALYLASDHATVWAEWYRWLAATARRPLDALPRDMWRDRVSLDRIADLSSIGRLEAAGLPAPEPASDQWPSYQRVGEQLFADGWQGVLYLSAAHPESLALCVFRTGREVVGIRPVAPPEPQREPPTPPTGLRT